jgi:MFS family permease
MPPSPQRTVSGFTPAEARLLFGASAAYALRMFGTYMALPVLSPYAASLPGAAALWTGLSVGAYGLTQAVFQIPLGLAGDRYGRGRVLALGLVVFGLGSWICAAAATAPALVLGRLVQGAGAMAATMIALLGDRTRESVRTRAMAALGSFIAAAFAVGLVTGPAVAARLGVPALFAFAAVCSGLGLVILPWALGARTPELERAPRAAPELTLAAVARALARPALVALYAGILALHLGLTALFVVLPLRIRTDLPPARQWRLYAPVLALGFLTMALASRAAESRRGRRVVVALGSLSMAASCLLLAADGGLADLTAALALFVVGFACLEPSLAAQVTRHAEADVRGTAAGVFNSAQFVGVFLGGLLSGATLGRREPILFLGLAALQVLWLAGSWRWLGVATPPPPSAPPVPARGPTDPAPAGRSAGS